MLQRLLLGMDDSGASAVGLSYATALARQHDGSIHVLYVNQFMLGGRGHTTLTTRQADELVEVAVEELRANGVPATGTVRLASCYNVARRIVETAEEWSADTIVLGSHRHRRLHRLAGQGVRERVIQLTALPVLTTPAPLQVEFKIQTPVLAAAPPQPISRRT